MERDISHAKDALGQQFCERLLQLSSKAYIFWLSCRAPMATSVLINTIGQGLFPWQAVGLVFVQLNPFSSASQTRLTRSMLLPALNCWGRLAFKMLLGSSACKV